MPIDRLAKLRRADPDRYFTALFAPAGTRDRLVLLYLYNDELARALDVASEPAMALIRLQWWREIIEGANRPHELATPLAAALAAGQLHAPDLLALLDAREAEIEQDFSTLADLQAWLMAGPGRLAATAAHALGASPADQARCQTLGAAYGLAGTLRSLAHHASQGRCILPDELLAQHRLTRDAIIADPATPALTNVRTQLATLGHDWIGPMAPVPPPIRAAALPAIFARRDFKRPQAPPRPRGLGDKLAVSIAALTGHI